MAANTFHKEYDEAFDTWLEEVRKICKVNQPLHQFYNEVSQCSPHDYFQGEEPYSPEEFANVVKNTIGWIELLVEV